MNKIAILAAGASGIAATATAYYVSPSFDEQVGVAPVIVEMPANQALSELEGLSLRRMIESHGESARDLQNIVLESTRQIDESTVRLDLRMFRDRVLQIDAKVKPEGTQKSSVDIVISFPESRFSTRSELDDGDLETIATVFDLMATEFVSAQLNDHRQSGAEKLRHALTQQAGITEKQAQGAFERAQKAMQSAYGELAQGQTHSHGFAAPSFAEDAPGGSDWGDGSTAEEEESNYRRANEELEQAARSAEEAAQRAEDEASRFEY